MLNWQNCWQRHTVKNNETDTPALYRHAVSLYNQLAAGADESGVYTGSKVEAFRAIGVSQGYYSTLYGRLEEMGCIETLHSGRGGGGNLSRVQVYDPPDLDKFQELYRKSLTKDTPFDTMQKRLSNLEGRLPEVDLASVIADFEARIDALEKQGR